MSRQAGQEVGSHLPQLLVLSLEGSQRRIDRVALALDQATQEPGCSPKGAPQRKQIGRSRCCGIATQKRIAIDMRKLIGLVALLSALGLLGVAASGAFATGSILPTANGQSIEPSTSSGEPSSLAPAAVDALCEANKICVFNGSGFGGESTRWECSGAGDYGLGAARYSALNRCGNKSAELKMNGTVIACMNPGGERPSPGAFNTLYIFPNYGAVC
jgi:hypothetical protein